MSTLSTLRVKMFVLESNRIEGIIREPLLREVSAHLDFWSLEVITVDALEQFVRVVADASLRRRRNMDVQVGSHRPPRGGPVVVSELERLLDLVETAELTPYEAHREYELLHPFTDGNGRSGRALWAWHMTKVGEDPFALPFLHRWYYQSLDAQSLDAQLVD